MNSAPAPDFHTFANGVKVYGHQLLQVQRDRYTVRNVHEAEEEDLFVEAVAGIPPNGCYVSVGSAIGYYPILARRLRPDVAIHCFEPLRSHRAFFVENITLNGLRQDDFAIHPQAVAGETGTATLIDDSYASHLAIDVDQARLAGDLRASSVAAVSLGDVFRVCGIEVIDLIQFDIQGLEAFVLHEYFRTGSAGSCGRIDTFVIGTHGARVHEQCESLLRAHGYAIRWSQAVGVAQPDGILCAARPSGS